LNRSKKLLPEDTALREIIEGKISYELATPEDSGASTRFVGPLLSLSARSQHSCLWRASATASRKGAARHRPEVSFSVSPAEMVEAESPTRFGVIRAHLAPQGRQISFPKIHSQNP